MGAAGLTNSSLLAGLDGSNHKLPPPKNQAHEQAACPIAIAAICRLTAGLISEAVEIAMGFGINILAAAREDDDEAILRQFRGFDAAARTARQCAEELRTALRLLESEGVQ